MFSEITDPITKQKLSLFSSEGRKLLKNYIKLYKSGGSGLDTNKHRFDIYIKTLKHFLQSFHVDVEDPDRRISLIVEPEIRAYNPRKDYTKVIELLLMLIDTDGENINKLNKELKGNVGDYDIYEKIYNRIQDNYVLNPQNREIAYDVMDKLKRPENAWWLENITIALGQIADRFRRPDIF